MPDEITISILELAGVLVGIITGVIGLLVAILGLWPRWYPIFKERADQKLLKDKFSRGPYDPATIEAATRYYVQPQCTNIDPGQEAEIRHALVAIREELFSEVDKFLDTDGPRRHLLILADSGMGKTSFVLNYYAHNERRKKQKRHKLALVYLGAKDADDLIRGIPDQENTVLFLDAFDEDTRAIEDHHQRIRELMGMCKNSERVVITCRTQFFPADEEIPVETGIAKIGPRKAGDKGVYEFWKLYLAPFDDEHIERYLKKRYPFWRREQRRKARETIDKIPLLSVRPMLLAYIPDLIESDTEIKHSYELYETMIEAWLERESKWVNKNDLRKFSEHLAVDLYLNRESRGMERIPIDELTPLAENWNIDLQLWQISGRSLLNRDAQGNYKFAHRSIMEYLFARQLVEGNVTDEHIDFTDQLMEFLLEQSDWFSILDELHMVHTPSSVPLLVNTIKAIKRCLGEEIRPGVDSLPHSTLIRISPGFYGSLMRGLAALMSTKSESEAITAFDVLINLILQQNGLLERVLDATNVVAIYSPSKEGNFSFMSLNRWRLFDLRNVGGVYEILYQERVDVMPDVLDLPGLPFIAHDSNKIPFISSDVSMQSMVFMPLLKTIQGTPILFGGALALGSLFSRAYRPEDFDLLQDLADYVSLVRNTYNLHLIRLTKRIKAN